MMDDQVKPPTPARPKRAAQVRLEKLDADTIRKVAKLSGVEVPYLLREAVSLVQAKYSKPQT
jgi:hypothetical protein